MVRYVLSFKPVTHGFGSHDPSAAIFRDGSLVYGIEEERLSRQKHATDDFPSRAIQACLDYCNIKLNDIDRIYLPYEPSLYGYSVRERLSSLPGKLLDAETRGKSLYLTERTAEKYIGAKAGFLTGLVRTELAAVFDDPIPPLETLEHHRCHAASAHFPAPFDEGLVVTVDGLGEYDATVVWRTKGDDLKRVRTYEFPNSLGHFFGAVTDFLGYRAFNGEGKVMGLAPYGNPNEAIESTLRAEIDLGVDYDVTGITDNGIESGVARLEELFGEADRSSGTTFTQWEKDFAYTVQRLLEETVTDIVDHYATRLGTGNIGLAGGVALNCKMNKRVMELPAVETLFIQPVAHDGGLAIGAGYLDSCTHEEMTTVYLGNDYKRDSIRAELKKDKIEYIEPDDLERYVAERIADGELIGWHQGRMEMGPRALGNRSIVADPRTIASRDRVNEFVKHREEWRPFSPSLLEDAMDEYLVDAQQAPFMIKTFDVPDDQKDNIPAVLHPADDTTRPQTVNEDQNPRYYRLINEFESITGVPVVLNTSFNDHGEPIVNTPQEAIKDFFGMGLDVLVVGDFVVEKGDCGGGTDTQSE